MRNPLLVMLLMPALEIGLLALFAARYGLTAVAAEVFLTSGLGLWLLRRSGYRSLLQANERLRRAEDTPEQVLHDLIGSVAGVLLLIPGIATDVVGLSLLLPWVRRRMVRRWLASGQVFQYSMREQFRQPPPARPTHDEGSPQRDPGRGGDVIEGEFTRED